MFWATSIGIDAEIARGVGHQLAGPDGSNRASARGL